MRPANLARARRSPSTRRDKTRVLRDRRHALPGGAGDALAGGDAGLHDRLDAGDLAGDDVGATLGLALDRADLALGTRAVAADVALVAAALQLGDPLLGALARGGRLTQVGHEGDGAVARLERGADVHERGTLGDVAALLGGRLRRADVGLGGLARLVRRDRAVATSGRRRRRLRRRGATSR